MSKLLPYAKLAAKSLRARSVRSWITIIGIVVSIAVILTLLTLSSGLQQAVIATFNNFGTNRIIIFGPDGAQNGLTQATLTDDTVRDIKALPVFKTVIPSVTVPAVRVDYRSRTRFFSVDGFDPSQGADIVDAYHIGGDIASGRFLERGDVGVAVVGGSVAKVDPNAAEADTWPKPIVTRNSIQIAGKTFSVVGVLNETGESFDNVIIIPIDDARALSNQTNQVSAIDAIVKDNIDISDARFRLERLLNSTIGKDNYAVITPDAILRQFTQILSILQAILVALASISLIVGAVGIMNTMFTSVLEREKEIGIMKSIGSTNGDIMLLFMIEAGLIGLIGGVAGVIFGIGLSYLIGAIAKASGFSLLIISISPIYVIGCLLFSFVIGMVSGIVPSYRAARKKIVDTLREA